MPSNVTSGVYAIVHVDSQRRYIGSSRNIKRRVAEHMSLLARGAHHNSVLQALYNESGPDAFTSEVIEHVTNPLRLVAREQYHIDQTADKCLLNRRHVADSSLGVTLSAEARAKISAALRGRKRTPEHIEKSRLARLGSTLSDSAKTKLRKSTTQLWNDPDYRAKTVARMRGVKRSPEACANMGAARVGQKRTDEQRERMRQAHLGQKHTSDQSAKKAAAMRTRWADPAYRARLAAAHRKSENESQVAG